LKDSDTALTRASSVYETIRRDIMNGEIPPGGKLLFDNLRAKYDIGISPLREALNRLDSEGWVLREERKGFRAAPISEGELREIVRSRILIEGAAIAAGIERKDVEAEERIVLAYHRLNKERRFTDGKLSILWEKLHKNFHMSLIEAGGLAPVTSFCSQLFDRAERYRILCASTYPERNERDEHARIFNAFVDGDAAQTIELLSAHYQVTVDMILESGLQRGQ
jgi:GntR family transcriptional regulator, carbon starvation induced regulator